MKEPSNATIKLERAKINEAISKEEEYRDEDILIKNGKEIIVKEII